jgi:hypothetical protein
MKRLLNSLLVVVMLLALSSCDKELSFLAKMTAKIDGNSWSSIGRTTIKQANTFLITGTSTDGDIIVLTINGTSEGVYILDPISATPQTGFAGAYNTTDDGDNVSFIATSGELSLTEVDSDNSRISGSFAFSARTVTDSTSVEISSGIFEDLKYTSQ